jgi:UDP-glucose 4-epimerase
MHHFISGIAGFIGSQLADILLAEGHRVSGADDLSLGREAFLAGAQASEHFRFRQADVSDPAAAARVLKDACTWGGVPDVVWHLAANSDIAAGGADPAIDFSRTIGTTFAMLEAARGCGVKHIAFASTSAVYGERGDLLTEDSGPLLPISNYGAAKLASEALLSAAAESFLERLWIFRFPNVVGRRATHGAIYDFIGRLQTDPAQLTVLGDGTQTKPYLYVSELIAAIRFIVEHADARRNVFNIGPDGAGTNVKFMAEQTVARAAPGATIAYTGGDRGWVGDVPRFAFSTERLSSLGWRPALTSDEAVLRAIAELVAERDGHG